MLFLYNTLIYLSILIGLPILLPYVLLSSKRRKSLIYKLGWKAVPTMIENSDKDDRPTIWIHALSVGEVISALPLVDVLKERFSGQIIISASTLTGYNIACERLKDKVDGITYSPYDFRFAVNQVLDRIRPSIALIVETDAWPNMIDCLQNRGIPVLLVNARMSDRSLRGYRRYNLITSILFQQLSKICVQTTEDAHRYAQLGVSEDKLIVTGNLKFDQTYPTLSESDEADLKIMLGIDPGAKLIVAGSTHEGEEEIICRAFIRLLNDHAGLLLINAPRDPGRSADISRLFAGAGLEPCLLSEISLSSPERFPNIVVIDTIGLLVKLYALSDISIVGGSLLEIRGIGGHNPLEPAAYAKPVIYGENMRNFRQIAGMLESAGGALKVADVDQLTSALRSMLEDEKQAHRIGQKAYEVFSANKGAVARTIDVALMHMDSAIKNSIKQVRR